VFVVLNVEIVVQIGSFQIRIDNVGELTKLRLIVQRQNFAPWHLEKVKKQTVCLLAVQH